MSSIDTLSVQADLTVTGTGRLNIELAASIGPSKHRCDSKMIDQLGPLSLPRICSGEVEIHRLLFGARKSIDNAQARNPRTNTNERENVLIRPEILRDMLSFHSHHSRTLRASL